MYLKTHSKKAEYDKTAYLIKIVILISSEHRIANKVIPSGRKSVIIKVIRNFTLANSICHNNINGDNSDSLIIKMSSCLLYMQDLKTEEIFNSAPLSRSNIALIIISLSMQNKSSGDILCSVIEPSLSSCCRLVPFSK